MTENAVRQGALLALLRVACGHYDLAAAGQQGLGYLVAQPLHTAPSAELQGT